MPDKRITKDYPLEIKQVSDTGVIEGYASVFDVVDSYSDVIVKGAFKRTLKAWESSNRMLPVLWQHDAYKPIGVTMKAYEDDKGLAVTAQLVTDVQQAKEAYALARAGALGGMSIGFSIPNKAADGMPATMFDEERKVNIIREVKLWEYSLVTYPANEAATIDSVKATVAELEKATEAFTMHYKDTVALIKEMRLLLEASQRSVRSRSEDDALTGILNEARQLLAVTKGK